MSPLSVLAVGLVSLLGIGMIVGLTSQQIQYNQQTKTADAIQNDKVKENLSPSISGSTLSIDSKWGKQSGIKEIRVVDDNGNILQRYSMNSTVTGGAKQIKIQVPAAIALAIASGSASSSLPAPVFYNGMDTLTSAVGSPTLVAGHKNSAVSFSGSSQALVYSSASQYGLPLGSQARTIDMWVKPTGTYGDATFNGLLRYGTTGTQTLFLLGLMNTGQLSVSTGSNDAFQTTGTGIPANQWTNIGVVYNTGAKDVLLYINGVQVQDVNLSASLSANTQDGTFVIGCSDNIGRCFSGSIDEVYVYGQALSSSQMAALAAQ